MSISSTDRKAGPYACNGAQVVFDFDFKVFEASDLRVVKTDSSAVETDLTLTTHYTVSLNADQDANPGGTITTVATYATGNKITITSEVPETQGVNLANLGGFYPATINKALDRLTILVQQLAEKVARAPKVDISSTDTPEALLADIYASAANASAASASASAAAASASNASTSEANAAAAAAAAANKLPLAGGTMSGDIAMGNNDISGAKTVGFNGEVDNGNSGTGKTITLADGQKQKITLTDNATLTISFTGAPVGQYQLRLIQDGTGGRTVTWSGLSASRWLGSASAPAINSAINGEAIISIYYDGTNAVQSAAKVGAV